LNLSLAQWAVCTVHWAVGPVLHLAPAGRWALLKGRVWHCGVPAAPKQSLRPWFWPLKHLRSSVWCWGCTLVRNATSGSESRTMTQVPRPKVDCTGSSSSSESEDAPIFLIVADASPVMMSVLQAASSTERGCKLLKRSQLVGKKFRPVVDLQWLPHSLVDWQLVLDGGCMCNHFCARSVLVRKAELYQLLQDARGSDCLPVTPVTRVLVLPHNKSMNAAAEAALIDRFCEGLCGAAADVQDGSSDEKWWMLKAGNSSNGNGIHLVTRLEQVASLLKAEEPRGSWCVQDFVGDAALVHGCRYSVRLLVLLASSQVRLRPAARSPSHTPSVPRSPVPQRVGVP